MNYSTDIQEAFKPFTTVIGAYYPTIHFTCEKMEFKAVFDRFKFNDSNTIYNSKFKVTKVLEPSKKLTKNKNTILNKKLELFSEADLAFIKQFLIMHNKLKFEKISLDFNFNNKELFFYTKTAFNQGSYTFNEDFIYVEGRLCQAIKFDYLDDELSYIFYFAKFNGELYFLSCTSREAVVFEKMSGCVAESYFKFLGDIKPPFGLGYSFDTIDIEKLKIFQLYLY